MDTSLPAPPVGCRSICKTIISINHQYKQQKHRQGYRLVAMGVVDGGSR